MEIFDEACIIVGHAANEVTVYGRNGYLATIPQNIDDFINRHCKHHGMDLITATYCVKDKLAARKNIPICLCPYRKIIFFKIQCKETKQKIWFRYSHDLKYKKCVSKGVGIYIDSKYMIRATFSRHRFQTQIKRVNMIFLTSRRCSSCTRLDCTNCKYCNN